MFTKHVLSLKAIFLAVALAFSGLASAQTTLPPECANLPLFDQSITQSLSGKSTIVIPPGQYQLTTPWAINGFNLTQNVKISAYGVELFTCAQISAVKISSDSTPHQLTIEGLTINHRNNNLAIAGFELTQSSHVHLVDCTVEANGVGPTYAGIWLHNKVANNNDTGNFWTVIDRFTIRKRSGADQGDIKFGINLQGATNATVIQNSSFSTVYSGINIMPEIGYDYMGNGMLIQGNWFEGFAEAIKVNSPPGRGITGLRILSNRAENTWQYETTFFRYAGVAGTNGSAGNEAEPPILAFNYLLGVRNLMENDAQKKVIVMDSQNMTSQTAVLLPGR